MELSRQEIFAIVRSSVARNLEIDVDLVDRHFRFHHFLDMLATMRRKQSKMKTATDYIEAANIYIDLSERFEIKFFTEFTSAECVTIDDLVTAIEQALE